MPKIVGSNILTALNLDSIGSQVRQDYVDNFITYVEDAIICHEQIIPAYRGDRVEGQYNLLLSGDVNKMVISGVGRAPKIQRPDQFVIRAHRGQVGCYLKRLYASKTEFVRVIVDTMAAYIKDPDVKDDPDERDRMLTAEMRGYTHVLVAVLAGSGDSSPLPPYRLVHNLAGGNNEALLYTADEIRAKAKESLDYWNQWHTVAD
jgi:hypothetical protein